MIPHKALVLLSGGQDSTTCLFWALSMFKEVEAISFHYGQKHAKELQCAVENCADQNVKHTIINLQGVFGGSALVDHSLDVSGEHAIRKDLPATFTAGRNIVFLAVAGGYAFNNNIRHIITGVCQTDYSGYPDCRRSFVDAMGIALSEGLGTGIQLFAPLMNLSKAETWKLAKDLGCLDVIINKTLTDYNGDETMNEWGKGREDNPASSLRAKGYREAKEKGWV